MTADLCHVCRTTVDLAWNAVSCPCGAVILCGACDEIESCDVCRDARVGEAS